MTTFNLLPRASAASGGSGTSSTRDYVVRGSDSASTDNASLQAAVAAANIAGGGTVWIDGTVYMTSPLSITAPVSLRGLGPHSRIIDRVTSSTQHIVYNQNLSISESSSWKGVSTASANADYITVPGTRSIAKGSTFAIWSHDKITSNHPHLYDTGGISLPMEIHRVKHWDQQTNRLWVESICLDRFQYAGQIMFFTPISNVVIDNLEFITDLPYPVAEASLLFHIRGCNNLTMENIRMPHNAPGGILIGMSTNVKLQGIVLEDVHAADNVYGIVAGGVNGMLVSDCILNNTRHAFTTTSGAMKYSSQTVAAGAVASTADSTFTLAGHGLVDGMLVQLAPIGAGSLPGGFQASTNYAVINAGSTSFKLSSTQGGSAITVSSNATVDVRSCYARIGGPINTIVRNCVGHCQYMIDKASPSTRVLFDTHSEGNGVVFENITVNLGASNGNYAFGNRARNTVYRDCRVIGKDSSNGVAFYTDGPGTIYTGCVAENTVWGIATRLNAINPEYCANTVIDNCRFKNVRHPVISDSGSNLRLVNSKFTGCSSTPTGYPSYSSSCVIVNYGSGHVIAGNVIPKESANQNAFDLSYLSTSDVTIAGNVLTGYGDSSGIRKFIAQNCTVSASADTITSMYERLADNWPVKVVAHGANPVPTGLSTSTTYYVINYSANGYYERTFQLSEEPDGSAVDIEANGVCSIVSANWAALEAAAGPVNFSNLGLQQRKAINALGTQTGNFTVDWTVSPQQSVTLSGAGISHTITFVAPLAPGDLTLIVTQDSGGGETIVWPTLKGSEPVVSTSSSEVTAVRLYYDGTHYHAL